RLRSRRQPLRQRCRRGTVRLDGGLRHSPITPPAGTATQRSPSIGQYGGIEYGALPVNYAVFGNLLCPSVFNIHRQQPLGRGLEKNLRVLVAGQLGIVRQG